jgi:hypothetical protein
MTDENKEIVPEETPAPVEDPVEPTPEVPAQ